MPLSVSILQRAAPRRRPPRGAFLDEQGPSVHEVRAAICAAGQSPSAPGVAAQGGDLWIPAALPNEAAEASRPLMLIKLRKELVGSCCPDKAFLLCHANCTPS